MLIIKADLIDPPAPGIEGFVHGRLSLGLLTEHGEQTGGVATHLLEAWQLGSEHFRGQVAAQFRLERQVRLKEVDGVWRILDEHGNASQISHQFHTFAAGFTDQDSGSTL